MRILTISFEREYVSSAQCADLQAIGSSMGFDIVFALVTPGDGFFDCIKKVIMMAEPDAVIVPNMLRGDLKGAVPGDVRFITWMHDEVSTINCPEGAARFNAAGQDLIIGYAGSLLQYGFDESRLLSFPMLVNPDKFRSSKCSRLYDIVYASNKLPYITRLNHNFVCQYSGLPRETVASYANALCELYDYGDKITTYESLRSFLGYQEKRLDLILFWWLNDLIYRKHTLMMVMRAGHTIKTACQVKHSELSELYRRGLFGLYLNAAECCHHAMFEILMSGRTPLVRRSGLQAGQYFSRKKFISEQRINVKNLFHFIENGKKQAVKIKMPDPFPFCRTFENEPDIKNL